MLSSMQILADAMRDMAFSGNTSGVDLAYFTMAGMYDRYMMSDTADKASADALLVDADVLRRYRK